MTSHAQGVEADLSEPTKHARRESLLRIWSRCLPVVLILLVIATASLVVGIVLQSGVWINEEVIHGPFPTEPGNRVSVVPVGASFANVPCCVGLQDDAAGYGNISALRAWLNGTELNPPHMMHAEIRTGQSGGFSHWGNYILFYIPESVPNDQFAVLRVQYPIQYSVGLLRLNIAIVFCLFVAACASRFNSYAVHVVHSALCLALIASVVALAVYAAFLAIGYFTGQPVPAIYVFHYLPIQNYISDFEPYFPVALMTLAFVLTALSWVAGRTKGLRRAIRLQELRTLRVWRRCGLLSIAGFLFIFIAAGAWSGNVLSYDSVLRKHRRLGCPMMTRSITLMVD